MVFGDIASELRGLSLCHGRGLPSIENGLKRGGSGQTSSETEEGRVLATWAGEEVEIRKVVGDVTLVFLSHCRSCPCNVRRAKQAQKWHEKWAFPRTRNYGAPTRPR
jgi:hypothetical protein